MDYFILPAARILFVHLSYRLLLPVFAALLTPFLLAVSAVAQTLPGGSAWKTDVSRRSIDLGELMSGGPPKDGIPAIDDPQFIGIEAASAWLKPQEPVLALAVEGEARAYPLQIMTRRTRTPSPASSA